jgi:diketogulonate reductase-like aldo/keto reductase
VPIYSVFIRVLFSGRLRREYCRTAAAGEVKAPGPTLALGGNVLDCAINYRSQRSERAVGRGLADGVVELRDRATGEREEVALDAIVERTVAACRG